MVRKPKQQYIGWVYCLPYTLAFLFGTIIPMLYSVYLSLFTTRMVGGTQFVGFENYLTAFKDVQLWNGFTKVSVYFIIQVPFMLICATILALMLDSQRIKHVALPRILLFLRMRCPAWSPPSCGVTFTATDTADWSVLPRHRITSAGPVLRETHPVRHREHHHLGVCGLQHAHHLLIIEGASRRTV